MISRNALECQACGAQIVTRTTIGHGDSQVHAFPCPKCGVGITYKLYLDQKNVDFDYDAHPENAKWLEDEDECKHQVTFCAELLLPRGAFMEMHFSPFLSTVWDFRDVETFQRQEDTRRQWLRDIWPITQRLPTHYENENWTLFDAEAKKLSLAPDDSSPLARLRVLSQAFDVPFEWMLYPNIEQRRRIQEHAGRARTQRDDLVAQLAREYKQSGRMHSIWRQLQDVHVEYVQNFRCLSPLLQAHVYWKATPTNLAEYVVCDKRFNELKALYMDAFETLARISVITMAFECIISHGNLSIPTARGSMDIWAFEKLPTAKKVQHIRRYSIGDLFAPLDDRRLRNGIGHNSARYDASTDEVVCVYQDGALLSEERVNYTVFCDRTMVLMSTLYWIEMYFWKLLEETDGALR